MSIVGISLFSQVSADNITSSSWKTHYVRLMPTFSGNLHANVFLYFWLTLTFFPEKSDACFTVLSPLGLLPSLRVWLQHW